ncbi:hypothetical protein CPJCM30710_13920 [Clostridium polyendosporum]|uniref:Radical SAM core domain-containing protein n=1 Tax=Clostridium polyendosporum TaxID=69208 RepID=A0A919VGK4_9CLOT|nr:radical SAM protein [Clostridium polyendosporum]GIM28726.1 hypothetical protein CPJCM30710_13920 [Clostridium polyendosporum]
MSTTWGQLGNKLINQAKSKKIPIAGQFELTSRCNLKCKMCYVARPINDKEAMHSERSAEEWIRLAHEARDEGMLYLLLTGGEIFIRPDFKRIYEETSMMGFNIELYTNATMITPEIAKWLSRIPPSRIGITMYGASPETYGKVCGNANGFESAVRGIDLLLSKDINLWLKTTVIQDNAKDFDELAEFAEKRGVEFGIVNYISPRREDCSTCPESHRLSPKELIEYELYVDKYFRDKPKETLNKKQADECSNITDVTDKKLIENKNDAFKCPSGKCAFWVTWDGKMTPCALMNNPHSSPFEKGFSAAWNELQDLCSSVPICRECDQCSLKDYCMSCPARLQVETGFYDKPAQYLCELAKIRKNL